MAPSAVLRRETSGIAHHAHTSLAEAAGAYQHRARLEGRHPCLCDAIGIEDHAGHFRCPQRLVGLSPAARRQAVSQDEEEELWVPETQRRSARGIDLVSVLGAEMLGNLGSVGAPILKRRGLSIVTLRALRCPLRTCRTIFVLANSWTSVFSLSQTVAHSVVGQLHAALLTALDELLDTGPRARSESVLAAVLALLASKNHRVLGPFLRVGSRRVPSGWSLLQGPCLRAP